MFKNARKELAEQPIRTVAIVLMAVWLVTFIIFYINERRVNEQPLDPYFVVPTARQRGSQNEETPNVRQVVLHDEEGHTPDLETEGEDA